MKLKTRKETVIDLQDWDDFVQEIYGRPYSFQQQDGCKDRGNFCFKVPSDDYEYDYENDTVPEIVNDPKQGVSFKAWLARDPKQPIKNDDGSERPNDYGLRLWWHRNFYPDVSMIIQDLHQRGLLEEGEYTINIDW